MKNVRQRDIPQLMITNMHTQTKTISGAKALIEALKSAGVDTIFGYPGGIVLDVYDELGKDRDIKHILMRHEQSAVHAAEGYARQTGKCGIVLVTSGPGAANTISGIVNAYLDGFPLVILTGQVSSDLTGKNAFQEADICNISKTCTKKTFQVKSADDIQKTIKEAIRIATSGKKGPVVVDLVKDIFKQNTEFQDKTDLIGSANTASVFSTGELVKRLLNSQKPVIICGGGVNHSNAQNELVSFAFSNNIPVVCSMMGLGAFPQSIPNYFGMIGIFGDNSANEILKEADLILSLGCRFNDRITCKFNLENISKKYFQVDINSDEISNFVKPSEYLVADIKDLLNSLKFNKDYSDWLNEAQKLKELNHPSPKRTNLLHTNEVLQTINEFTKGQDITFTSEVGQHLISAVKHIDTYKNRKLFVSGGSGTMGFGFPASIGASVALKSSEPVVCITGDGSFQMGLHELAVCKDYGLNIKIMIINNGYLGMVRQLQEKHCNGRYSETRISNPDFIKLGASYGIDGIEVSTKEEILPALKKAFTSNKTFIINFNVEPMEVM